ncbi:MAG TPA: hypothetical protein VGB45_01540 [Abditibacterium sp.]|jgi:hypothetical protein
MTIEEYLQAQKDSPGIQVPVPATVVMELRRRTGMGVLDAKQVLEGANSSLFFERLMTALITQLGDEARYPLHDPIEDDPALKAIFAQAEQKAEKELESEKRQMRQMGFCHLHWGTLQRILREEFGVEWFTPSEMNPHIIFD